MRCSCRTSAPHSPSGLPHHLGNESTLQGALDPPTSRPRHAGCSASDEEAGFAPAMLVCFEQALSIYARAMTIAFHPLDPDVRHRELVYVSRAKLEQLLLPKERTGAGATVGGFGANRETHRVELREQLNDAAKFFQDLGILSYEIEPQRGQWLLLRAVMKCGTAWPSFGAESPADETAWWVGSSASARVLAYGHRKHLLGQGAGPQATGKTTIATWCPSRADAYGHLLKDISLSVQDSQLVALDPWGDDAVAQVRGLEDYFFSNDGVYRNSPLIERGIYEMMLRVDRVVEDEESVTVLGSPLWVARERRPVQGVYHVQTPLKTAGQSIVGEWNGREWLSFEIRQDPPDGRIQLGIEPVFHQVTPEDLDFEPSEPSVDSIRYLGKARWPQPEALHQMSAGSAQNRWWQRVLKHLSF